MKEAIEAAVLNGEKLPEEPPFDSNCITPGTEFMAKLSTHLRYYVRKKVRDDPLWKGIKVIYSGHEVPGEGEHKIIKYIRHRKAQADWNPGERHCMYGLDADLMFLGLVTHEPNFSLLREVVVFKSPPKKRENQAGPQVIEVQVTQTKSDAFQLLHLWLFRDYLDQEFRNDELPFGYSLERVIDDLVFMCFFVGNDFLPHLPTMDIREKSLDVMFQVYQKVLPTLPGYLTDCGKLILDRVEIFMKAMAELEALVMQEKEAEEAETLMATAQHRRGPPKSKAHSNATEQFISAQGNACAQPTFKVAEGKHTAKGPGEGQAFNRKPKSTVSTVVNPYDAEAILADEAAKNVAPGAEEATQPQIENGVPGGEEAIAVGEPSGEPTPDFPTFEEDWKARYYFKKFGPDGPANHIAPGIRELCRCYVEGLAWVMHYYYDGVVSWSWYFPYHYAPLMNDLTDLPDLRISFELGQPFTPFQQLLGVLPPASGHFLPKEYRKLMVSPSSPLLDMYPENFEIDMEGYSNPWEGVVKLPFFDEARLRAALAKIPPETLTDEEIHRNTLSDAMLVMHDRNDKSVIKATIPGALPDLDPAMSSAVCYRDPDYDPTTQVFKVVNDDDVAVQRSEGFPTLSSAVEFTTDTYMAGVNVFGNPSRKESTIVRVADHVHSEKHIEKITDEWLGKPCFVNWPYVSEAIVVGMTDGKQRVFNDDRGVQRESIETFNKQVVEERQWHINRGIDCGDIDILLFVKLFEGMQFCGNGTYKKSYAAKETTCAYKIAVRPSRSALFDPRFAEQAKQKLKEVYPVDTDVLFCGNPHFGSIGKVVGHGDDNTVDVEIQPSPKEMFHGRAIAAAEDQQYVRSHDACRMLKM